MSFPLSSLPDELALSCLARVSRFDHAALSLASKVHRSLVLSPEFYKMRSLLGYTKKCFYLCLTTGANSTPLWFTLNLENPGNRFMSPVPSFPSQSPNKGSSVVALDWGIYVIGGLISEKPISDVLFLDCRTHTWRKLPSMGVARAYAGAGVVDGKIYVVGGCEDNDSSDWGEVFDPKTQTWDTLGSMTDWRKDDNVVYSIWCGGDGRLVYYSPNDYLKLGIINHCCVIEKLVYRCDGNGKLFWRELEKYEWKEVDGLESLLKIFALPDDMLHSCMVKHYNELRNFGDNVVLIWFKYNDENVEIWCAEISFERREEKGEIWGSIEWLEAVATVDRSLKKFKVYILNAAYVNV